MKCKDEYDKHSYMSTKRTGVTSKTNEIQNILSFDYKRFTFRLKTERVSQIRRTPIKSM